MLLYSVSKSLNVQVKTQLPRSEPVYTHVEGENEHARLMAAEHAYRDLYTGSYNSASGLTNIKRTNIATASLTVLYSKVPRQEGNLSDGFEKKTFDILSMLETHKNQRSIHVVDTYDKDHTKNVVVLNVDGKISNKKSTERNSKFINHVQKRINIALQKDFNLGGAIQDINEFETNPQFPETFFHSEQAKMDTMIQHETLVYLAKEIHQLKPVIVAAFIEDMYSSRPMCVNCNLSICGCQQPGTGSFLTALMTQYKKLIAETDERVRYPVHDVTMHTRVSAEMHSNKTYHYSLQNLGANTPESLMLGDHNREVVLQKSFYGKPVEAVSAEHAVRNYHGDYFLSSHIPVSKLDNTIIKMQHRK